jgi:hypothetical protein
LEGSIGEIKPSDSGHSITSELKNASPANGTSSSCDESNTTRTSAFIHLDSFIDTYPVRSNPISRCNIWDSSDFLIQVRILPSSMGTLNLLNNLKTSMLDKLGLIIFGPGVTISGGCLTKLLKKI